MLEDLLADVKKWKPKSLHLNVRSFTSLLFVKYGEWNVGFYDSYRAAKQLVYLCWQVNDGEIQQRRRYLEQQRDRILAHKKCSCERILCQVFKNQLCCVFGIIASP